METLTKWEWSRNFQQLVKPCFQFIKKHIVTHAILLRKLSNNQIWRQASKCKRWLKWSVIIGGVQLITSQIGTRERTASIIQEGLSLVQNMVFGQRVGLAADVNGMKRVAQWVYIEGILRMRKSSFVSIMENQTPSLSIQIAFVGKGSSGLSLLKKEKLEMTNLALSILDSTRWETRRLEKELFLAVKRKREKVLVVPRTSISMLNFLTRKLKNISLTNKFQTLDLVRNLMEMIFSCLEDSQVFSGCLLPIFLKILADLQLSLLMKRRN